MKIRQAYPWQRFLVPRGGNISVDGLGLLRDPESAFGAHANPDLKTLAEIDHAPVVVLLGEPGIGKSTLLEHAAEIAGCAERDVRWLDLAEYASEDPVSRRLSELTSIAKEVDTDLLIDSLDTGLLAIPTLAYVLAKAIRQHPPRPSFRLRIACRSADWPRSLEQALMDHWGATSVEVVEVAPLRRCDVACAARAEGLDDARFIDELRSRHAGPFAASPLTLRFLLDSATAGQPLPATRAGLYREGCERLAAEQSEPRRELKREGNRSPAERLAIAGRIAAVLTMTDRDAVWIGPRAEIDRVRDLSPDELIGELRFPDGSIGRASVDDINEVLSSGLFSLRQSGQLHFAHQTYREFLAAWHLDQQGLPAQRQLDLLCTPGERTLVPQLVEVAAWAAALDEDMFRGILPIHPPVLLTSDLAHRAPELRAELVDRILVLADQATWADTDWGLPDHYPSLAHDALADQLRPWISNSERFLVARRIAIDIAEACKLSALSQPLLDVALSRDDAPAIRVQAIDALDKLADRPIKSQLLPLVEITADQDPSDGILAAALRVLWPDLIDFRGLSPHLHPPREPNLLGGYWRFLNEDLAAGLSPREVPQALVWMRERLADEPPGDIDRVNDTMARSIVARAFRDIAQPGVAAELARFAVMFMELGRALFEGPIGRPDPSPLRDDHTRRRLLLALLPAIQRPQHAAALLSRGLHRGTALLLREDVPWLLDLADKSAYPTTAWTLARLLQEVYNPELAPGLANPILERCATNPVLKRALRLLWRPVSLSSRQAESARESRAFHDQLDQEHRQRMPDPPPAQRVETALERIEAGEPNAFVDLLRHLGWSSNREYDYHEPLDPRELPGWHEAASATRSRIVDAACAYLQSGDPEYERLVTVGEPLPSTRAASRGLYLRDSIEQEAGRNLPTPDWHRWAPAMLPRFNLHEDDKQDWIGNALRRAYDEQPQRVLETIRALLQKDIETGRWAPTVEGLDAIWDDAIAEIVANAARVAAAQGCAAVVQPLFAQLAMNDRDRATALVNDLISPETTAFKAGQAEVSLVVARRAINQRLGAAWPAIERAIQASDQFGQELVQALADDPQRDADWWSWLPTPALGDLALRVEQWFFATPSQRELRFFLEVLRNGLIAALVKRGEPESVAAMQALVAACPQTPWLRLRLADAREALRRATWRPPSPAELLTSLANPQRRLVRNDEELLEVILASLDRLHDRLHGWNGLVRSLWNEGASASPKEEDFLSDFVRDHLAQDVPGIVAQREVQVRRLKPRGSGERTDILVTATSAEPCAMQTAASVVIETKGCWNDKLLTAMEHQLKQRYLIDSGHRSGLYLVGWYQHDNGTRQCATASRKTLAQIRAQLDEQAMSLSEGDAQIRAYVLDVRLPS